MAKAKGNKVKNIVGNFLSQVRPEQRRHERFNANLPCTVHYFKDGIRERGTMSAQLLNISAGGALIKPQFILLQHTHLYLALTNYPFKIAAVIVNTSNDAYHLKFVKELPDKDVQPISTGAPYKALLNWRGDKA